MTTAFIIFGLCVAFVIGVDLSQDKACRWFVRPLYASAVIVAVLSLTVALTLFFAK